jgi:protein gp37
MSETIIRWATHSWNPYTWNCNKVSPGCKNCYAATLAERYGKKFDGAPQWRGANAMKELLKFPAGSVLFVNSMSDTYHELVPTAWIHSIHNLAAYVRPDITFLLLTKRPERAYGLRHQLVWPKNLWLGTSVENDEYLWRLAYLTRTPASGRFVSAEPLLGSLKIGFEAYLSRGINWVIVGGESGGNRRDFNKDWAREIRDMCIRTGVPFMYKQGSAFKSEQDKILDGREWSESPFTAIVEKVGVRRNVLAG